MIQLRGKAIKDIVELQKTSKISSRVLSFGFDGCGFTLDGYPKIVTNGIEYNFVQYDSHVDLNEFDVCIIPSGIFESITRRSNFMENFEICKFDHEKLLEFERMVVNFLKNKKVIIFLMSGIKKQINGEGYSTPDISHTDLAKKMLLNLFPQSGSIREEPHLKHNRNEFQKFTEKYGIGKTRIYSYADIESTTLISSASGSVFGVELFDKRLFFLPYHTTNKDFNSLNDLSVLATESVLNYIQNHTVNIPEWVKAFTFIGESSIQEKITELKKSIDVELEKLIALDGYKSLLCNQGDPLAIEVVKVMKSYFGLNVDDKDEKLDDFSILDDAGEVLCSGEIKGVAGDCKRQYLSQLNANRDMKGYPEGTKGLLIINDGMKIKTISEKFLTAIANDCLIYAEKESINIIRTIDLLNIMALLEDKTLVERKEFLTKLLKGKAGWIKCDSTKVEIVKAK